VIPKGGELANKWQQFGEGITGIAIMAFSLVTPFLNPRRRRWGMKTDEVQRNYPRDELVPDPKGEYMHGITIHALASEVWPWLVQMGQGRGGFYSYELLENFVGCKMHNADRIIPELQNLEIGDSIPMHPTMGSPYRVRAIDPGRSLVLLIREDMQTGKAFEPDDGLPEKYQNMCWLFFLDEQKDGTTRLISRSRNDWNESFGNKIFYGIFGPLTVEMDRKMLKGIKKRVEAEIKAVKMVKK
jgi:hypothetical protein